ASSASTRSTGPRSRAWPNRWRERARAVLYAAVIVALAAACRGRVPDMGGFAPVLSEDGRVVELLQEADALAGRAAPAAAAHPRPGATCATWCFRARAPTPRSQHALHPSTRVRGRCNATWCV